MACRTARVCTTTTACCWRRWVTMRVPRRRWNRPWISSPRTSITMYALVDFFYRRGRLIEAMALVERMIRTHPENRLGYELKQAIGGQ